MLAQCQAGEGREPGDSILQSALTLRPRLQLLDRLRASWREYSGLQRPWQTRNQSCRASPSTRVLPSTRQRALCGTQNAQLTRPSWRQSVEAEDIKPRTSLMASSGLSNVSPSHRAANRGMGIVPHGRHVPQHGISCLSCPLP
jgi:hypothetical protein